jgi:hypothetical protein
MTKLCTDSPGVNGPIAKRAVSLSLFVVADAP